MNNKIKNKKGLIFLSLFLLVVFIFGYLYTRQTKNPTTTTKHTNQIATFGEIKPGQTSLDSVNEVLGFPVKNIVKNENNQDIAKYATINEFRNHEVIFENSTAELIKEAVNMEDDKNSESIKNIYGLAPYVLYEKSPNSVFNLYVYPENGIAYLGHEDGTLFEVWYFRPTNIDEFIKKWGSNYSTTENSSQSQY